MWKIRECRYSPQHAPTRHQQISQITSMLRIDICRFLCAVFHKLIKTGYKLHDTMKCKLPF